MASTRPEAEATAATLASARRFERPIRMPWVTMLRRPESSGSKPALSDSSVADMPSASQRPASGRRMPAISRISVDLPAPLPPTTPTFSPRSMRSETSRSAITPPAPRRGRSR